MSIKTVNEILSELGVYSKKGIANLIKFDAAVYIYIYFLTFQYMVGLC